MALAVRDAVEDIDLPKVDDFGSFLLVVLHALDDERIETYELDCFLSERRLVTIHDQRSASIDALWDGVLGRPELASGGPDRPWPGWPTWPPAGWSACWTYSTTATRN